MPSPDNPLGDPGCAAGVGIIWLDTTPEVSPFRYLMANLRDRKALVIPTGKPATLMETEPQPPFRSLQSFTADAKLNADGTLTAKVQQSARGDAEVMYLWGSEHSCRAMEGVGPTAFLWRRLRRRGQQCDGKISPGRDGQALRFVTNTRRSHLATGTITASLRPCRGSVLKLVL